jgi:hypothetical protein
MAGTFTRVSLLKGVATPNGGPKASGPFPFCAEGNSTQLPR